MAADSKVDELPRSGKRGELMKLDADIAEQRKKIGPFAVRIPAPLVRVHSGFRQRGTLFCLSHWEIEL